MFVWIIPGLLGKAAYEDILPKEVCSSSASSGRIVVAAEYGDAGYRLVDEPILSNSQVFGFINAVRHGLGYIQSGRPVVFVCQQGKSRSVTVMCVVAALYEGKTFQEELDRIRVLDPAVLEKSPIQIVAEKCCPECFS